MRCPRCKSVLPSPASTAQALTNEPAVRAPLPELRIAPISGDGVLCQICQSTTVGNAQTITCPNCQQVYHKECWDEIGGCGTYGCASGPSIDKSENAVQSPLTAWGDTKQCPACGETIKSIALRCRYCGTDFSSVDPLSLADLHRQVTTQEQDKAFKSKVIAIFIGSLIGVLAPIVLIVGLIYLLPRKKQLRRCGPVFAIMGYTSLGLSALYSVLMLLFLIITALDG
jgi:hypothetical protein